MSNGQSTTITINLPPTALSAGSQVNYYLVFYGSAQFYPLNIPISVTANQYSINFEPTQSAYTTTNPNNPLMVTVNIAFGQCQPPTPLYIFDQYGNQLPVYQNGQQVSGISSAGQYQVQIIPANYGCTASSFGGRCATVTLYLGPNSTTYYASTTFNINYQPPQQCPLSGVTNQSFQSVLSQGCWNCSSTSAGNSFPVQMCSGQSLTTTLGIPSPQCTGAYYLNIYMCTSTPCTSTNAFFSSNQFNCGNAINYFSVTIPSAAASTGAIYVTLTDTCGNSVTASIPVSAISPNYTLQAQVYVNGSNITSNPNVTVSPGGTVNITDGVALVVQSMACVSSNGYTVNVTVTDPSGNTVCTTSGTVYPQVVVTQQPTYTNLTCSFTAPSSSGVYTYTITTSIPTLNLQSQASFNLTIGQATVTVSNLSITPGPGAQCGQPSNNVYPCQGLLGSTFNISMTLTNTGTVAWNGQVDVYDQSGMRIASSGLLAISSGASTNVSISATIPTTYAVGMQYTWYIVTTGPCSNCMSGVTPPITGANVIAIMYVTPGGAVTFSASGLPYSVTAVAGQTTQLSFTLTCNAQAGVSCPSSLLFEVIDTANNAMLAQTTVSATSSNVQSSYSVSLSWTATAPNIPGNTSCFGPNVQPQCGGQPALYASCIQVGAYDPTTGKRYWSTTLPYIVCPTAVKGAITASLSTNSVYFIQGGYSTYQNVFVYLNNTTPNTVTVTCSLTTSGGQVANICFVPGNYTAPCTFTQTVQGNSSGMGMFQVAYSQSAFPSAGTYNYTLTCSCGQNCTVSISNPTFTVTVAPLMFAVIGPNNCTFSPSYQGVVGNCSVSATVNQQFQVPITVNISMAPSNSTVSITVTLLDQNGNTIATQSATWCNYSGSNCNYVNQPVQFTLTATAPSTSGYYNYSANIVLQISGQTVGNITLPIIVNAKPQITFAYGFVAVPSNTVQGPNGTSQILELVIGCNCPQPTQFRVKIYRASDNALIDTFVSPQVGPNAPGNVTCPSQAGNFCSQYYYYTAVPISIRLPSLFELIVVRGIPQSTLVSNYATYGYLWSEEYNVVVEPITLV